MKKIIKTTKFQILFIIILTFFSYSNSLSNGLVWDDHLFVERWKETQSFDIVSLLKGSAPEAQGGVYRPIRSIIYAIDYKLWGQNPFFYHFQAILIHVAATLLVYFIAKNIFNNLTIKQFNNGLLAFIAALLFGLHPIHTETIDYISASMETFGSLFFFASFYLYLISFARSHLAKLGSLIFALLAFFTYEMTLTLPFLVILYDYIFGFSKHSWGRYLPYFGLFFSYLVIRIFVLGILSRTDYLAYSFYHTQLTMVKVFARYIFLLIFPFNLTTNHNLVGNFPSSMLPYDKLDPILKQSIFDLDVLLGLLGILGLLALAIKILRKYPIISFCIGWFFILLLPVSYIIPHGGAMAEKYLYIPSLGFVLIVGVLVHICHAEFISASRTKARFRNKFGMTKNKALGITILVLIVIFYGFLTLQRNTVWRNDITVFSDMAKKSPYNLLANYTLGVLYGEKGDFSNAVLYYQRAINTASDFWEARYNLGNIYSKLGNVDLAKKEYEKVLQLNKDFVPAKNNLDLLLNMATNSASVATQEKGTKSEIRNPKSETNSNDQNQNVQNVSPAPSLLKYSFNEISFMYPKGWSLKREETGIVINDESKQFTIEMKLDKKADNLSTNEYVKKDKDNYGLLINEGLAKIPTMDWAYVKMWKDRLQFFLFKKDNVIKVLVYPSDSSEMQKFDTILGSISLNEKK